MKRKIVRQANRAYTLTLPIEWVRENGLDRGSEVDVAADGRSLIVSNDQGSVSRRARIDVSNFEAKRIYLHLNSFYAAGVDEIEVISEKDISSVLLHATNNLLGFALVSQDGDRYTLKDIGGFGSSDLDEIFKRVFQSLILFFQSAIRDVFGEEKETLRSLVARDLEVNKLCLFLQRAINKMSYGDAVRGRALFTYSFDLEKIGDDILRFWRVNVKDKPVKPEGLKEVSELCLELLGLSFDIYYGFDSAKFERLYLLRDKIGRKVLKVDSSSEMVGLISKIAGEILDLNQLTIMINYKLE